MAQDRKNRDFEVGLVGWDQGLVWGVICACRVPREGIR